MASALWGIVSHPGTLLGPVTDISFLLLAAAVGSLGAAFFMAVAGKRILRASRVLAVLVAAASTPALLLGVTYLFAVAAWNDPGDGSGMLILILLYLAILALPFGFIASMIYIGVYGKNIP